MTNRPASDPHDTTEKRTPTPDDESHEGTFAEGQAETPQHPEDTPAGDAGRGMRQNDGGAPAPDDRRE